MIVRSCLAKRLFNLVAKMATLTLVDKADFMVIKSLLIYPFWIGANRFRSPAGNLDMPENLLPAEYL